MAVSRILFLSKLEFYTFLLVREETMIPDRLVNQEDTSVSKPPLVKQEAEEDAGSLGWHATSFGGKISPTVACPDEEPGNGKGGGIALSVGPGALGVSERILREDYILQVAYLTSLPGSRWKTSTFALLPSRRRVKC